MPSVTDIDVTRTFTSKVEAAWRSSHSAIVYCYMTTSTGEYIRDLQPIAGSVTVDARRSIRRTVSLQFVDYDGTLMPTNSIEYPLGPFAGNLIVVCRGISQGDTYSLVPLGTFAPRSVSIETGPDGTKVSVDGDDTSSMLSVLWPGTYDQASGVTIDAAISAMLTAVAPYTPARNLSFNLQPTTYTTPKCAFGVDGRSTPWESARVLGQAAGQNVYMGYDNRISSQQWADPEGDAQYRLNSGSDGVLLSLKRSMSASFAINAAILKCEGSGLFQPLSAAAYLQDNAATNYAISAYDLTGKLKPYGTNGVEFANPFVNNQAQANAVALLLLNSVVGVTIEAQIVPLPHLDAGARVQVYDVDTGVNLTGIVDAVTYPLESDAASTVTIRTKELA